MEHPPYIFVFIVIMETVTILSIGAYRSVHLHFPG